MGNAPVLVAGVWDEVLAMVAQSGNTQHGMNGHAGDGSFRAADEPGTRIAPRPDLPPIYVPPAAARHHDTHERIIIMREYRDAAEYQAEATRLTRSGWEITSVLERPAPPPALTRTT